MKTTLRHFLSLSVAAVSAAVLTSCGGGSGGGSTIKVGEFASLTGSEATFGTSSHEGTLLAIEEINAAGGLLGKKLELITYDNQSKQGESTTIAKKLITRDNVVALLGEVASGRSKEAAPTCQTSRIPMISPASTNPDVTQQGDYIFRVCFIDPFQARVLANFASNSLKATKVAVLTDAKNDYSKGLSKFFKEQFAKNGGMIVTELNYSGGDKDFKSQLTAIKGAGPDAVFVPGYYTEVALVCRQARELGLNVPMFGGDGWEGSPLVEIGKEAVEGNFFSTHCSPEQGTPEMKAFVEAYKKRFNGKVPDAMAALGYDSAKVLAAAIAKAGTTEGPKLRDAIAATKDFAGASGTFSIDEQRNAVKSAAILQIQDGKFRFHETVAP